MQTHTNERLLTRFFVAAALALLIASIGRGAVTINVGTYYLPANALTQIQIPVTSSTGSDQVPGLDLYVQVGDGGPQLTQYGLPAGTAGPAITSVSFTTGTIFSVAGATQFTPPGNIPQVWFTNVALAGGGGNPSNVAVPVSGGSVANLTISTSGFSGGAFPLLLNGVVPALNLPGGFSTDFTSAGPTPTISNGSIVVVPVPTAAYWQGNVDGNWSTGSYSTGVTNWKTDAGGATDTHAAPGSASDVFFVTTSGASNFKTTLDADFSIKGLTFTSAATNAVTINGNHTLTLGTDGLTLQAGAAAANIATAVTLGSSQTWTVGGGNPLGVSGAISLGSLTLTKAGAGTLQIDAAPTFGAGSALVVTAGTLRFSVASGAATIGTGVTATIASGATLELAGSVSALATGSNRVNITNNSQQSSGGSLLVSGANQQVGRISGNGDTVVDSGVSFASLTANSIVQNALVIGGLPGSPCLATIAASDAAGNPLAAASELALAGSLQPTAPFGTGTLESSTLLAAADQSGSDPSSSSATLDGVAFGESGSAVPEPASAILLALGSTVYLLSAARRAAPRR